jgi:dephospho-CoA kinase
MGNLICITGPMAAGKNELSLMLEKCGWLHIDADVLAHFAIDNCKEELIKNRMAVLCHTIYFLNYESFCYLFI